MRSATLFLLSSATLAEVYCPMSQDMYAEHGTVQFKEVELIIFDFWFLFIRFNFPIHPAHLSLHF